MELKARFDRDRVTGKLVMFVELPSEMSPAIIDEVCLEPVASYHFKQTYRKVP